MPSTCEAQALRSPDHRASKSNAAHVAVRTPDSPSLGTQNSITGTAAPRQSAVAHKSLVMAMCTGKSAHATAPTRCMLEWAGRRGVGVEWRGGRRVEWRGVVGHRVCVAALYVFGLADWP